MNLTESAGEAQGGVGDLFDLEDSEDSEKEYQRKRLTAIRQKPKPARARARPKVSFGRAEPAVGPAPSKKGILKGSRGHPTVASRGARFKPAKNEGDGLLDVIGGAEG